MKEVSMNEPGTILAQTETLFPGVIITLLYKNHAA